MTEQSNTPLYGRGGEALAALVAIRERANALGHDQYAALAEEALAALSHPCREVTEEEIARIVDPSIWGTADRLRALDPDRDLSGPLGASLTKARAILAALSSPLGAQKQGLSSLAPSSLHVDASDVEGLLAGRPLGRPRPQETAATWRDVIALFERHGLQPPPTKLRDELVGYVVWAQYGERLHDALAALSPLPSAVSEDAAVNPMSVSEDKLRKTINGYPRELTGFSTDCRARLQLTVLVEDLNAILGDLETYRRTLAMIGDPLPSAVSEPSGEGWRITKHQRFVLEFLEHKDRAPQGHVALRKKVGMLRTMAERGLLSKSIHGEWSITKAGRAALSAAPSEPERGGSSENDTWSHDMTAIPVDGNWVLLASENWTGGMVAAKYDSAERRDRSLRGWLNGPTCWRLAPKPPEGKSS